METNAGRVARQNLQILPYDSDDADHKRRFAELNIEWLEQYFSVEPVDHLMFADPVATIIAPGGAILMAILDGQIVGTCALIRRSEDVCELAKMAVTSEHQAKGIGAALVAAIEDKARAVGVTTLYLVSSIKLPHAVPTYRKLGYVDSARGLHELYQRSDITLEKHLL